MTPRHPGDHHAPTSERVWNFSAGPAALPLPVLERVRDELLALPGSGASILEVSHRSSTFGTILEETEANLRALLRVPDRHRVLFLQGGASLQFAMVPMNVRTERAPQYVVTGAWGAKALDEARTVAGANAVWDGGPDGYASVPELATLPFDPEAAYVHVTSNETIGGVQLPAGFEGSMRGHPPLVCDASSDLLSRPIDVSRFTVLYAGAQKNAGIAGLTIAIVGDEVLDRIGEGLPRMLDYRTHAKDRSLYNTPPTFAIYVLRLVMRWLIDDVGGLDAMAARNEEKAALLYDAIDASDGFYRGHARRDARSLMNVTWRLRDEELESRFVAEARAQGLVELAGHRSVGGIRASIYNAMPMEGVRALRAFMDAFVSRNG